MQWKRKIICLKIRNINEQLSTTFSIVFKRLLDLEKKKYKWKAGCIKQLSHREYYIKTWGTLEEIKTKKNNGKKTSTKYHQYKCNQCDFTGKNQSTVNKHMDKKHDKVKTHQDGKKDVLDFECSLCEDMFSNIKDLDEHISENLEDISKMDIDCLKSGYLWVHPVPLWVRP